MKKTITIVTMLLSVLNMTSQNVSDFETFTLSSNSFYKDTNSVPFQVNTVSFEYEWTKGSYPYWSGGFSYTNKYDSVTAGYTNLYGVKPLKGYNNSNTYVIAQDNGLVTLTVPQTTVEGFYITNTTYAYEAMQNGDSFARKFGDTTGTGSGTTIPQGSYPDFFKVVVRGYLNGAMKSDSTEYYLADFRFASSQDYIRNTWNYVNTAALGAVDSIRFFLRSSDMGPYGMNTPAFFAIDNFTIKVFSPVGVSENSNNDFVNIYPNPFKDELHVDAKNTTEIRILDISGKQVFHETASELKNQLNLSDFVPGMYFVEVNTTNGKYVSRIIKN